MIVEFPRLSRREKQLIDILQSEDRFFTRDELYLKIYTLPARTYNDLANIGEIVRRIRKKYGFNVIQTKGGKGYRFAYPVKELTK